MGRKNLLLLCALVWSGSLANGQQPADAVPSRDYVIGIEDQLRVFVWGEPELTVTVKVRPDGKITVPLINDVEVAGLTTEQVRHEVQRALGAFIREPLITVIVEEINSYRVYFLGEIQNQGALQFYQPTRLLQAIAAAGGMTEFAKKEITLLREENGGEKRTRIDYKRLIAGEGSVENFYLKAGDTLVFN